VLVGEEELVLDGDFEGVVVLELVLVDVGEAVSEEDAVGDFEEVPVCVAVAVAERVPDVDGVTELD
jgi:hypothetical protein